MKNLLIACLLFGVISPGIVVGPPNIAVGQNTEPGERFRLDGVVKTQNKYSVVVATRNSDVTVKLNPKTKVELKIQRASYDLPNHRLVIELPISAVDGNFENNERIHYELPDPLFVHARFPHLTAKKKAMSANVKRLANFRLSSSQTTEANLDDELEIAGRLTPGSNPKQMQLIAGDGVFPVTLGNRDARLTGFSILDLKPYHTDVFVSGVREGDEYFADEILFVPVGDPVSREQPDLPRCLFLGDNTSFNYQRPLREALDSLVNLHHPPENCRGSANWPSIPRWLGAHREAGRQWDVITFNFGLWDIETTKDQYQSNLRNAIELLQESGAKLIWVTSTPIDYGFNTDNPEGNISRPG